MPAGISALAPSNAGSFDHEEKDPAFAILQKDGLDPSLPLLNPNEQDEVIATRFTNLKNMNMKNDLCSRRRISKSNDHLVLASLQSNQTNPLRKKHQSKSQDNLDSEERPAKLSVTLSTENFNEVLTAKLKKIQAQSVTDHNRKFSKKSNLSQRKPFITTVKTGEFLMPPPEVAVLLGIAPNNNNDETGEGCPLKTRFKQLVLPSKRPEIRHSSHNARCPAALKATVDFSLGLMNATAIAASTLDEHTRKFKRNEPASPQSPRALPKKLEPIEGTTNAPPRLSGDQPVPFGNLMFDRRVARGSTCTSVPALMDGEHSMAARQAEARRKYLARKRTQATKTLAARIGSPPPVPGRKHEPVQTEIFLEELIEKPDESEAATQTDFSDKPPTPKYYPGKIGRDVCTQIEPGELFDFDIEVQPILEVLVGKTIEQALTEVLEEEEIAAIKEQQRKFLELRAAEQAEEQRLAEEERRLREEKEQRLREQEAARKAQQEEEERNAAAVLLSGYIAELLPAILDSLKKSGYLVDEIKTDVEEGFMPWLMEEVKKEMGNTIESRELLMEIIREILENRAETYRKLGEEYDAERDGRLTLEEILADEGEGEGKGEDEGAGDTNYVDYQTPATENGDAI